MKAFLSDSEIWTRVIVIVDKIAPSNSMQKCFTVVQGTSAHRYGSGHFLHLLHRIAVSTQQWQINLILLLFDAIIWERERKKIAVGQKDT